jgi:hypothetical protein
LTTSSEAGAGGLDLERDLPTTEEDVAVLRELRGRRIDQPLVHINRLLAPGWTLEAAAARPLFTDCPPFELKVTGPGG